MNIISVLLAAVLASSTPAKPSADAATSPQSQIGDLYVRVQQLEEQNRKLQGRTEELEHKLTQLDSKNQDLQKKLDEAKAKAAAKPLVATPPAPTSAANTESMKTAADGTKFTLEPVNLDAEAKEAKPKTDPSAKSVTVEKGARPEEDFDRAFNNMTDGKNAEAISGFSSFVKKYPSSELSGESYYWLGEMAYADKDYNNAAIDYLKGYRDYPKGEKAPENILKLAITLKDLGRNDEACQNLGRFKTEFKTAHTNLREKAESLKQELRCK